VDSNLIEELKSSLQLVLRVPAREATSVADRVSTNFSAFRMIAALRFRQFVDHYVSPEGRSLRVVCQLFFLESFAAAGKKGKATRIGELLKRNLLSEDKLELVSGFLFSAPYEFSEPVPLPLRHLMFKCMANDGTFVGEKLVDVSQPCSGAPIPVCHCRDWLQQLTCPQKLDRNQVEIFGLLTCPQKLDRNQVEIFGLFEHGQPRPRELARRQIAQGAVRPVQVVVDAPGLQFLARVFE